MSGLGCSICIQSAATYCDLLYSDVAYGGVQLYTRAQRMRLVSRCCIFTLTTVRSPAYSSFCSPAPLFPPTPATAPAQNSSRRTHQSGNAQNLYSSIDTTRIRSDYEENQHLKSTHHLKHPAWIAAFSSHGIFVSSTYFS